jgi:phosphoribosylformimino-5-aminoimidazole carboxamide ribotide isomerase
MIVIPAIDIKGGKVVRLTQGKFTQETVYSDSPVEMARKWASYGVEMIHIVDLDGAKTGSLTNLGSVKEIAGAVKVKIELGGGMRDEESIKAALGAGVEKVVLGTKALDEQFLWNIAAKFRENLVVGIDASEGLVHTKGWVLKTNMKAVDLARKIASLGIKTINYTDISKDGMLEGPNLDSLREMLQIGGLDVIAAGGVSSIDDIKKLKVLEKDGLKGIIIGKALYEGKLDLGEAVKVCSQKE